MIALIDADSLIYIIGYNHREFTDEPAVDIDIGRAVDNFVSTILTIVQADSYVGVLSPDKNFRHDVYKYAKYKGERPEKPIWFDRFAPVIKERLMDKWGFFMVPDLEADDVICALAEYYESRAIFPEQEWIICSPDKDLRQIAGLHYDYKKEGAVPCIVEAREAAFNFWYQMLIGDSSDNVKSVPGLGPVKAAKILGECEDEMQWSNVVMAQYRKYFGEYYGPIIFQETKDTLQLMSSKHRLWNYYEPLFKVGNYGSSSFINTGVYGTTLMSFNNTPEEASPFNGVYKQLDRPHQIMYDVVDKQIKNFFGE